MHPDSFPAINRREVLSRCGLGMAGLGLGMLLGEEVAASGGQTMAAVPPHFAPRAKRVIHLFLNGGLSHVDTFDFKPSLTKYAGQPLPGVGPDRNDRKGNAMPSPFKFEPRGSQ